MSLRAFLIFFTASMFAVMASIAGQAFGQQAPTGICDGPGAVQGEIIMTPQSGPAGSAVMVSGSYGIAYGVESIGDSEEVTIPDPGIAGPLTGVVWMDTGEMLAELSTDIDGSNIAHFSGSINIPAGAAAGTHEVGILPSGYVDPSCQAFLVTESVSQDAYVQTATSLPATGLPLLIPAAGFLAMASGVLFRRRLNT
ncbi:MAG: hypothetical protein Q7K29_07755 [Thermoleophilia bacterium]|nr:hypothetical protein [Thermoleophilia bacterium]